MGLLCSEGLLGKECEREREGEIFQTRGNMMQAGVRM